MAYPTMTSYPALWDSSLGISVIVLSTIFESFSILAVVLRIISRRVKGASLVFNDWAIIVALALTTGLYAELVLAVVWAGEGQNVQDLPPDYDWKNIYVGYMAAQVTWAAANSAVKVSILHLYISLFPKIVFRRICYILMAVTALYFSGVFLETFLICRPLAFNWDHTIEGSCGNQTLALLLTGAFNLIIDGAIVILPLPILWRLQMPVARKVGISAMFSIGAFICIVTLLRIIYISTTPLQNPTYSAAIIARWSILEPTLGIVNSCFPVLRPVMEKVVPSKVMAWTLGSTKDSKRPWSPSPDNTPLHSRDGAKRQFHRLEDQLYPLDEQTQTTVMGAAEEKERGDEGVEGGLGRPGSRAEGIVRTREWKVYSTVKESPV